jgi:excisionase family DNA binding protein
MTIDALDALTPEAVAEMLGCEPKHVIEMASKHKIPAVKLGRSWRFPAEALRRYLVELALDHVGNRPAPPPPATPGAPAKRGRPRAVPVPDLTKAR